MYERMKKMKENKSRVMTNATGQKKAASKSRPGFVDNRTEVIAQQQVQRKRNNTGMPDHLKSGIENISGYLMDDVKVHYNSDKPAQLKAHAFAQGTDIHLGSGQEKYLPHEAWHIVQQKQRRVKPTMQMKGEININDDASLEREADIMGARANAIDQFIPSVQLKKNTSQSIIQLVSASELMTSQKKLQNDLKDNDNRMREYWSSGFEFEFASYKHEKELPSHQSLATSKGGSELHPDLNFELETDNHWEIEISIPPLYFSKKSDIADAHDGLRKTLKEARDETIAAGSSGSPSKLHVLTNILKNKGIYGSSDWVLTGLGNELTVEPKRIKHPKKDQYDNENDEIYGQVNVTMTTDEIVHLMDSVQEKYKESPNQIEKSPLGKFFLANVPLKNLASIHDTEKDEYITQRLYVKMMSNVYAIPAIIFRKEPDLYFSLGELPKEWEMSSTVKELLSVWVKASNQDVIKSRPQLRIELIDELYIKGLEAKKDIDEMLNTLRPPACSIVNEFIQIGKLDADLILRLVVTLKKALGNKCDLVKDTLDGLSENYSTDTAILAAVGEEWSLSDITAGGYEKQAFTDSEISVYLITVIEDLNNKISAPEINKIKDFVMHEINSLVERMKGTKEDKAERPGEPWVEAFGSGEGVRKETFVQAMGISKEYLLTEIRSNSALLFWLSKLNENKS